MDNGVQAPVRITWEAKMNERPIVDATNVSAFIIDFECGELSGDATIALFQYLLDSGLAWSLQGSYGRTTRELLNAGYLVKR